MLENPNESVPLRGHPLQFLVLFEHLAPKPNPFVEAHP